MFPYKYMNLLISNRCVTLGAIERSLTMLKYMHYVNGHLAHCLQAYALREASPVQNLSHHFVKLLMVTFRVRL